MTCNPPTNEPMNESTHEPMNPPAGTQIMTVFSKAHCLRRKSLRLQVVSAIASIGPARGKSQNDTRGALLEWLQ
jgi:hypothetical protein